MSKRDQHFTKVQEYKDRFSKQSSEALALRLSNHKLVKEAAIAAREVLEERGVSDAALFVDKISDD